MLNKNIYLILIISLVFAISFWIGFNVNLLPAEASINAPIYDELFKILFIIGLIIFIGMTIAVIYSLFRFRKRNDQIGDGIALEGNLSLEIVWTIIPSIIVLLIGLYSYNIYDRMGGMKELNHNHEMMSSNTEKIWAGISQTSDNEIAINNLSIEVSAMQFAFLFNYPKGNFISGELHVPVDQKVSMKMESKDVIHAFWVPEFRIKQDIIPGQPTILNFTPTKVGKYPIICAELCGPYHGGMRASIIVLLIGLYSYNIYDRMGGMKELNHNHEMMSSNTEKIWAGISQTSDNEIAINNLSIEVSAMQFAFLFNYPKGNFISGELHVPVDQKVSMKMESKDVIHAFWVPEFRIKQDIIPGQPTILNFTPTKVGKYPIICAELCGPYHGGMRASIIVEEESDYNEWFNKNKKPEVNL